MVEVQYERRTDADPWGIVGVRKVVRMPDHVSIMDNLAEASHLLREIRSSNCLLFLGAGFSFPAKMPGWSKLLVTAAEKAEEFVSGQPLTPFRVSQVAPRSCLVVWGRGCACARGGGGGAVLNNPLFFC